MILPKPGATWSASPLPKRMPPVADAPVSTHLHGTTPSYSSPSSMATTAGEASAIAIFALGSHRPIISSIARTIPKSRAPSSAGSFADSMLIASSPRFREPASGGLLLTAAALWVLRSIFESSISHEPIPGLPYDLELLLCNMQRSHGERVYPLAALQHVRFFVMARANVQVL